MLYAHSNSAGTPWTASVSCEQLHVKQNPPGANKNWNFPDFGDFSVALGLSFGQTNAGLSRSAENGPLKVLFF
jgi:hypothetical protein